MTGKTISRVCDDIDEATLNYAEIKAIATGNPLIREKMELDNEIHKLQLLKASYDRQRFSLQDKFMITYPKQIVSTIETLNAIKEDVGICNNKIILNLKFPFITVYMMNVNKQERNCWKKQVHVKSVSVAY